MLVKDKMVLEEQREKDERMDAIRSSKNYQIGKREGMTTALCLLLTKDTTSIECVSFSGQDVDIAYVHGYNEGFELVITSYTGQEPKKALNPYMTKEDIVERSGGKVSIARAQDIMTAVRHKCNGGALNSPSLILRSELEYWENTPDVKYKERL